MMRATVLLVDPDRAARAELSEGLRAEGFSVLTESSGPAGLRLVRAGEPAIDAVVLEAALPGPSGQQITRLLRADGMRGPVMLVSARAAPSVQAGGLDGGADAYLTKPLSPLVTAAYLRALLRRYGPHAHPSRRPMHIGELSLQPLARRASWAGRAVQLSPREFALLGTLVHSQGRVLSKSELVELVWGPTSTATINAVEVYIGYVRRKLDRINARHLLRTVPGHGYQIAVQRPRQGI